MSLENIEIDGRIEVVKLEPGDVLVITTERGLSACQHQRLTEYVQAKLSHPVLILDGGMKLMAVKSTDMEASV